MMFTVIFVIILILVYLFTWERPLAIFLVGVALQEAHFVSGVKAQPQEALNIMVVILELQRNGYSKGNIRCK
ncbi:hypothetical protein [Clostridium sp.]|uniref:hypothetical protein n=1 Tax=Clostridium sp. TaxID=1506 RepID=UPI003FD87CAE